MEIPPFQIGIDIATSLSVMGAAIAFAYTQLTQGRKAREQALRTQRIEHIAKACADFANILRDGDKVVSDIRRAQAGLNVKVEVDDLDRFCENVDSYIRVNMACGYIVWATTIEKALINDIRETAIRWNHDFVLAVEQKTEIPSFDKLVEDLTGKVQQLACQIRLEVEKMD